MTTSTNIVDYGQYDGLCACGLRGLHACGYWQQRTIPIQPTVRPTYATGHITYSDPRVAGLEARIAELEATVERLSKRRPKPSKDAG